MCDGDYMYVHSNSVECLLFPVKKYVSAIHEFPQLKRWHQVIFCWILRLCKLSSLFRFFCSFACTSSCVKLSLKYFYGKQQTHQKLVHIYDLSPPLLLSGWIYGPDLCRRAALKPIKDIARALCAELVMLFDGRNWAEEKWMACLFFTLLNWFYYGNLYWW